GRIVAIGSFPGDAARTIDARGMVVAPGFIDIHTHYDAQVFWDPTLSPSSCHGVTTIVGGNCGFSNAPLNGTRDNADYLMRMLARVEGMPLEGLRLGIPWNWKSFGDYLEAIRGTLAINAAFMVGHSALRCAVMGARAVGHAATAGEIGAMQDLLRGSLAAGGLGFSTSIAGTHSDGEGNPVPSRYAQREELLALARVAGEFEGTSLEIAPDIGVEFTDEFARLVTDLSLASRRVLNWNVLIPSWKMPEVYRSQIGASGFAAAHGARVVPLAIVKPGRLWINFHGGFFLDFLPGWAETMRLAPGERKAALADPNVRTRLEAGARAPEAGTRALMTRWSEWLIAQTAKPRAGVLAGKNCRRRRPRTRKGSVRRATGYCRGGRSQDRVRTSQPYRG
ncbi:MAG: amidohydrolase family protein, partial [Betaproteobacteria bacterium]|nr:amidohydrolase family protein [Betaproteobacteria bacterium]